jgi:soluble cytochrome b562
VAPAPAAPAAPTPAAPATAVPAADLKGQLQAVLTTLQEAQLKKDIAAYMGVYSSAFPNSDQKRQDTLKNWEDFDFTKLVVTVDNVQQSDADHASALVTWYLNVRNRKSQEVSHVIQSYQVQFVKENGNWRIRELKEVT